MVIIPYADVEEDALNRLLEEYVTRDGTDYGFIETTTAQRVDQILKQLRSGKVSLCFDPETESFNILDTIEAKRLA